jgi:hypothetical protein
MRSHSPCCVALFPAKEWPPEAVEDDNRRRALCKKLPCVDLTGAGVYGSSPAPFAPCGNMTCFGECGPAGTGTSCAGSAAGICGLEGGGVPVPCDPGEDPDENFEEMLESQEGLRAGEVDAAGLPFSPGRVGAGFRAVAADSTGGWAVPSCAGAGASSTDAGGSS